MVISPEQLLEAARRAAYRHAPKEAEDTAQDAILAYLTSRRSITHPIAFLAQATRNIACNRADQNAVRERYRPLLKLHFAGHYPSPEAAAIASQELRRAMTQLRPATQRLVILKLLLGYSNEELARHFRRQPHGIACEVSTALKLMKNHLIDNIEQWQKSTLF